MNNQPFFALKVSNEAELMEMCFFKGFAAKWLVLRARSVVILEDGFSNVYGKV